MAAGVVDSANVVYDRETGRSRGFGFVEMATDSDATAAIAQFNGQEFDGRNMVVNEARPRDDRGGANRSNRGGYERGRGNDRGGSIGERERGSYGGGDRW